MHLPIKQKKIHDRMSNLFNNPQPKHCPIRAAQNPFNKNPWAVGVAALSLISAAVYLFAPLFSIPIFGFNTGSDYVRVFYSYQRYMDMATLARACHSLACVFVGNSARLHRLQTI